MNDGTVDRCVRDLTLPGCGLQCADDTDASSNPRRQNHHIERHDRFAIGGPI
jgi:hypothetical protein